jgi:hypothetical protein
MADISSALENMTLENAPPPPTQHHVLNLIYPAIRLLPDGTSLHLARPMDCAHREQPRLGTYHLSAENLSFFQDKDADIVQYRYELSDADLRRTFSLNAAHNAYPWLDLLFNLVYRCSDRAYLHVQEQLLAHVPTYASQQEAL